MESKNRLMAPHLQLNTGAQDSLLFDNTRSYFTNVGYTRTSNFQMELRDVDSVTQASLGGKATFTVPKAGDLLGPCDLMVEFEQPTTVDTTAGVTWGWVENVGYAMIEKLQFYVGGSNCVEELTGDQLNIINELMRDEKSRFHHAHTLRTGRPLVRSEVKAETLVATTAASGAAAQDATAIAQTAGYTLANSPLTPQVGDLVYMVDGATTTLIGSLTAVPGTRAANLSITAAAAAVASGKNLEIRRPASHDSFIDTDDDAYDRIISYGDGGSDSTACTKAGKKLTVPLGLFFTKHPSAYFPLAAVAGCNEVQVVVHFRQLKELLMCHSKVTPAKITAAGTINGTTPTYVACNTVPTWQQPVLKSCKLRCHYIHVTGPEATSLMNREHVRLMKMWKGNDQSHQFTLGTHKATGGPNTTWSMDLNFMHPVNEIVITIRKVSEMGSSADGGDDKVSVGGAASVYAGSQVSLGAREKNYFAYQGGKRNPNIECSEHSLEQGGVTSGASAAAGAHSPYLEVKDFKLTLNGQSRHLDGQGIDRDYLMNRLMPMVHSNTSDKYHNIHRSSAHDGHLAKDSLAVKRELFDRKEIYAYPFSLAPEAANPSGSVNFSKVSHAKLDINVAGWAPGSSADITDVYQVDVYGVHYNWLAVKDGRAMISFA